MSDNSKKYRNSLYDQFAVIGKATSSTKRLQLLDLLSQGERTVEVLADEAGLTVANASQHLQVLKHANLVASEKKGLFITYRLADPTVCDFLQSMRKLAHRQLAKVDQIKNKFANDHVPPVEIDRKILLNKARKGQIILLDVRPVEEYNFAHLPGAVSIPITELKTRLNELPSDSEIVAYCRGQYCELAVEAVEVLRANGFKAEWVEDSVPDWRSSGFPVEVAATFKGRN